MIHQDVELHNVAELRPIEGRPGLMLQRIPECLRQVVNSGAQAKATECANSEIRFVCDSPTARVTLSAPQGGAEVRLAFGAFLGEERLGIGAESRTIDVTLPERLASLSDEQKRRMPFAPQVRRLILRGGPVHFHGVEAQGLRAPRADERPRLRYLAYGTSITQGAKASSAPLTYAAQTAWRLGADLINLGMGGACFCEPEFGDYIASRTDWDFATLCLSVNMVNQGFTPQELYQRAAYLLERIASADARRPVVLITFLPYFGDVHPSLRSGVTRAEPEVFRRVLRRAVAECPCPNVHLIEGPELLTDLAGLAGDVLHPNDYGMTQIAQNLADRLRPILNKARLA